MATRTFPAITLWQPWASLIFSGDKVHETRSFPVPDRLLGERVAIHAAKRAGTDDEVGYVLDRLCRERFGNDWRETLPRGVVLGTVRIARSYEIDPTVVPAPTDRIAGNWTPGRWAWELDSIEALSEPIEATGRQGWWSVDLPEAAS